MDLVGRSTKDVWGHRCLTELVERFCEFDDFCNAVRAEWKAMLLSNSKAADRQYGPEGGLADSEIMTVLVLYHSSRFKNFKTFYNGIVLGLLRACFPGAPCYERFIALTSRVWTLLVFFLASRMGRKTDIYYIDSTPLPVCHNRRIAKHKVFPGLAARGKTSMGWFFGFKLHIVFNHQREIVALKLTPGNAADTTPVPGLTKDLSGKLFGDKGYIGQKLAQELLHRGLILMTRVRSNMKSLPVSFLDKALLATSPRRSSATSRNFPRSGCRNIARSSTPSPTLPPRSSPTRSIPCLRDLSASSCHS